MNFFQQIKLVNFRNFEEFAINFSSKCNLFFGLNGSGKTNLLEAISLFEKGRGFRKDNLQEMINKKNIDKMFLISSTFSTTKNKFDLLLSSEKKENRLKKKLLVNGSNSYDSIRYFENLYSIIWFLPEMERLFVENPSLRRNFFDRLIYGFDKNYLTLLNKYKKKILERSNILKQNYFDDNWIKQIEIEIADFGLEIYKKRAEYIDILNSKLSSLKLINKNAYSFKLNIYDSFFNQNKNISDIKTKYLLELVNSRNLDLILGGCKIGPHKSDIKGMHLEKKLSLDLCSTGQQKAIVISIIIAQCSNLINSLNRKPIILFDEVCSHLDKHNREILLELINSLDVQTFMTSTEKDSFSFLSTKANFYYIN